MKTPITTLLAILLLLTTSVSGQVPEDPAYHEYHKKYPAGIPLTSMDSILLSSLPEKDLREYNLRTSIPPLVDNSTLPYLRPVFIQQGASCGQASAIGYNFTYEMCHARGLSAKDSINQFATHFTWNFMNGGNGWFGSSYLHSFEVLRTCGNPDAVDYGGYIYDDGLRWITGYDKYYNSMHNRIRHTYQIRTGSEQGILQLKHWLNNHFGQSDEGGVASFYANTPWNAQVLAINTPEGGKKVITGWYPSATHAMTIVGYNDSIRWDYNEDGQYTNDIDINMDGIVNAQDWEIGAVKFVNSHGLDAQDSGFCYMMYKVLAEDFYDGGVWNQAVHIVEVNDDYEPQMALKITLKHDYRKAIRVRAGLSTDTTEVFPSDILTFPIYNFQGSNQYMQGNDSAEFLKTIEFGLDITPLASKVKDGDPARFFILVDENDPFNNGTGELISCALMDYTNGGTEVPFPGLPEPLVEDGLTLASVIHAPDEIPLQIHTSELPRFEEGVYYEQRIDASGGAEPYEWRIRNTYLRKENLTTLPAEGNILLMSNATYDTIVPVALDFEFPFYGEGFDTLYVHSHGYLQFELNWLPWPYYQDRDLLFRKHPVVAAFVNQYFWLVTESDGVWYEGNSESATFVWKVSVIADSEPESMEFAIRLHKSGDVEIIYGDCFELPMDDQVGGISKGNLEYYEYIDFPKDHSFIPGTRKEFQPLKFPLGMSIDQNGFFKGTPVDDNYIYDVTFEVKDDNYITDTKTIPFTSGLLAEFTVNAGTDDKIEYGETVTLDVWVKNISNTTISNLELSISINDPYITLTDSTLQYSLQLSPGMSSDVYGALSFDVSNEIPDQHNIFMESLFTSDQGSWHKEELMISRAPVLELSGVIVDTDIGIFQPGEMADMSISLRNTGHAAAYNVLNDITPLESGITVNGSSSQSYGDMAGGELVEKTYNISSSTAIPNGTQAGFEMFATADYGIQKLDTFSIRVGKVPVLVIDRDPNNHSGPEIKETLDNMGVISEYHIGIPPFLYEYQSIFYCLGVYNSSTIMNWQEGYILASYLEEGGNMYLESRTTWLDDPQTPLQGMFSIEGTSSAIHTDTISGVSGYFAEGLKYFNASQYPINFYYLTPETEDAFTLFQTRDNDLGISIARETENFKTIGCVFEFGELEGQNATSTREELMQRYLDFFDIAQYVTSIDESNSLSIERVVTAYPNPASGPVNFMFDLKKNSQVSLEIFTILGARIYSSPIYSATPGDFNITWNPTGTGISELNPGLYIYKAYIDAVPVSGKLVIINN